MPLLAVEAGGCSEETKEACPAGDQDCGCDDATDAMAPDLPDLTAPDTGGEPDLQPEWPTSWKVLVSAEAPEAVRWTADDLTGYLAAMGLTSTLVEAAGEVSCAAGEGQVVLVGNGLGEESFESEPVTDQTYRVAETRCPPAGILVELSGGGLLGRQYAGYEWLHVLGVRFFHPEEEYIPAEPDWPDQPVLVEHTPAFRFRSTSLHLTHPLAIGDAFVLQREEYLPEGRRYIDWQIKNRASHGQQGIGQGDLSDYGLRRGFMRTAGISLHNQQQGGVGIIDPDDPRSEEEQIAAAIEARIGDDPARYPQMFSFSFNPSEFTEIDDRDALRQITFIADYMAEHYPQIMLMTTNHGTAGEPTEHYGVRYYDLPRFAPPNLGVTVHPLMFYDLFRPAPVYGNQSFQFLYEFMVHEYTTRRLWYFPEAAWWLTFDIPVPLYLPITIEARDRDIQGIAFMLEGKLDGHRTFGTGHEWGYWQNEYCSFRMAADLSYRYWDCLADLTAPMGAAAHEVQAVVESAIAQQEHQFIYGNILRYLVGTDPETELALSVGVQLHPLPPAPTEIMRWTLEEVEDWLRRIAPQLLRAQAGYDDLVARLRAVEPLVPPAAMGWFSEILDGIEVNSLRARHAYQVYGAVVTLRLSQLRFDPQLREQAETLLEEALQTTQDAIEVIRRREQSYRYHPLERYIAGGPEGDQDDNWTIYHYRELSRTHHAYYYTRIDHLAQEVFEGGTETVSVEDTVLGPDETLVIDIMDTDLTGIAVDFGDGEQGPGVHLEHEYQAPGCYTVTVLGTRSGAPFSFSLDVAQLADELTTGYSAEVVEPQGAAIIEPVLPGLVFGPIDDTTGVLGIDVSGQGMVPINLWSAVELEESDADFQNRPVRLVVPVVSRSTATIMTSLIVEDAVLSLLPDQQQPTLAGDLLTQAIIDALVDIGGFDEQGARRIVASSLGYTPDTLPEQLSLVLRFTLR